MFCHLKTIISKINQRSLFNNINKVGVKLFKVSIIIPVYNAEKKIRHAISSVMNQTMRFEDIELIFIDDRSTDKSVEVIQNYINFYPNIKLYQLEQNSGSPSKPRNYGISIASSDYIVFLDSDDTLLENACNRLYTEAKAGGYDIVRGYLRVVNGNISYYANKLNEDDLVSKKKLVEALISKQSTTVVGIYKKDFLLKNNITFNENIRMGEDTIFLSKCYSKTYNISYIDECIYNYIKGNDINNLSSTQSYGSRELNDHLYVWREAQKNMKLIGLDYYKLRLPVGFRSALQSMLYFSNGKIPKDDFMKLHEFLTENSQVLTNMSLAPRLLEIVDAIIKKDFELFVKCTKKRIVINGYDLKFIKPLIPWLEKYYLVEIDEWQGHNIHDEKRSLQLLEWADIIFCEWLLGNAVWYTNKKRNDQLLFIRMHRFELYQNYGKNIDVEKVDAFITVGMYYYEQFTKKFQFPREKMHLIPNYVDVEKFNKEKSKSIDIKYNLAVIGGLPARKRIDLAVDILSKLLEKDSRYKLHIIGSKPEEVDWLWRTENERKYYENIYERISKDNKLKDAVIFCGWQDSSEYLKSIGYVLSVSDAEKPESFHLAPAEGMASGSIGLLLNWPGVEYIYPKEFIVNDIIEMANKIQYINENGLFEEISKQGREFVSNYYNIEKVAQYFTNLIESTFLKKN